MLQVSSQIPVTYIDESDFPEASLIILTAGSSESMEEQIIVERVSWIFLGSLLRNVILILHTLPLLVPSLLGYLLYKNILFNR
jgi:hypothetical protein